MISITLNLENEHLLDGKIEKLLDNLNDSQKESIAKEVLFKYLTDTIDYEKREYIANAIKETREQGITFFERNGHTSYYDRNAQYFKDKSDEAISRDDSFIKKYLTDYKTNKQSRLEKINEELSKHLEEKTKNFIESNTDLKKLITEKENILSENLEDIVAKTMSSIMSSLVFDTIQNARFSAQNTSHLRHIEERLRDKNI